MVYSEMVVRICTLRGGQNRYIFIIKSGFCMVNTVTGCYTNYISLLRKHRTEIQNCNFSCLITTNQILTIPLCSKRLSTRQLENHFSTDPIFNSNQTNVCPMSGPLFTLSSTAPKVESTGEQIDPETNHNHNSF